MTRSVVDYEYLINTSFSDTNQSIKSGVRPRWERKRQQSRGDNRVPLSASSQPSQTQVGGDRFIPNRSGMNMDLSKHMIRSDQSSSASQMETDGAAASSGATDGSAQQVGGVKAVSDASKDEYASRLSEALLGSSDKANHRIMSFSEKAPKPKGDTVNNLNVLYSASGTAKQKKTNAKLVTRQIPSVPSRILDAPDLMDDYYLNLLSWSDTNILAVALGQTVYLWNATSGTIQELCSYEGDGAQSHISSVAWVQEGGAHLAVGTSGGTTQLWDIHAGKQLRSMDGHSDRVGALTWNRHMLTSGSRDTTIVNHDVRVARHNVATLQCHEQEVCGLTWSGDGEMLASGGNDNLLCLWDARATAASTQSPLFRLTEHQAAVKALAWSPHERNLLATGGGTADRCIKFWNTQTGAELNSIDTGSQVCALQWNPHEKEILSSHGFARNQLCLWKYPSMAKVKELEGHTSRVLHMALSSDGCTVVSAAGDETLRFWDIFAAPSKSSKHAGAGASSSVADMVRNPSKMSWTSQIR